MHTPLLIGVLTSFALTFAGVTAFYLQVWNERRGDRDYLYFALTTASVSVLLGLYAVGFLSAMGIALLPPEWLSRLVVVPSKLGLAFMLHFALLHAGAKRVRAVMSSVYLLALAYCWLGLSGRFWIEAPSFVTASVAGFELHRWVATPTAAARPFYAAVLVVSLVVAVLMGRHWWRDRRSAGAFVGAIVFALVMVNEVGLRFDWYPTVPLLPLGFLFFSFGVSLTLLDRYGRTADDLERHNRALQQRSVELDASYRELQLSQQRLVRSEQLAMVGELAAVIAHEVRNPLAIVNNAVASLRKRHTTVDDRKTLLEIINEEMGRLDKLVGRLLNYARPVVLNRQQLPLRDLILRSLAVIEDRRTIDAELSFEGGVTEVYADASLLRQVFENIIVNAAQAMDDEGTLRVTVMRRAQSGVPVLAITFEDDGEGMSEESCEHAMAPFFTTRPTGTGLGLPIVGRIIEAHGGVVRIKSELGKGTMVTILLPERRGARLAPPVERERRISLLP